MTNIWAPGWVPGQQLTAFSVVTANYTLAATDRYIEADATAASFTLTLPTAVGCAGQSYTIKRVDSVTASNTVTVATTSGQTIDALSSELLVFKGHWLTVVSDGSNWVVIGSNYRGAELGYVESTTATTSTNTAAGSASLSVNAIPGLSLTVIGTGRPVSVEFLGYGYNATIDTPFAAVLLSLVGGTTTNQTWAFGHNHVNTGLGIGENLFLRGRMVLTAGTVYTFTLGMWVSAGTGHFYADNTTPQPMYLSVVGQ